MQRLAAAFGPRERALVALFCLTGVALSLCTLPIAIAHPAAGPWQAFLIPIVGLSVLAIGTLRQWRWAYAADLVALGAQIPGAIAAAWELAHLPDSSKGAEVAALGLDPAFGLILNLAISAAGGALFLWIVARLLRVPR